MNKEPAAEQRPTGPSAGRTTTGLVTTGLITARRGTAGHVRTCLPVRSGGAGGERWHYPEGDDASVVRGED
jgi:hypothetical protein